MPILSPWQANEKRRSAVAGVGRDRLAGSAARLHKRRLQDEILGRIACDEKLGKHHKIGAERGRLGAGGAHAREIARYVAHRAIDLRKANDKTVGRRFHGRLRQLNCVDHSKI